VLYYLAAVKITQTFQQARYWSRPKSHPFNRLLQDPPFPAELRPSGLRSSAGTKFTKRSLDECSTFKRLNSQRMIVPKLEKMPLTKIPNFIWFMSRFIPICKNFRFVESAFNFACLINVNLTFTCQSAWSSNQSQTWSQVLRHVLN
jgi:hypothetical protein